MANESIREMGEDLSNVLMQDLKRHPLLSQEEEIELAKRIEKGDTKARDKMVSSNLRLVVSVAKKYQGLGMDLDDLIQEGCCGLIRALEDYDYRRGY